MEGKSVKRRKFENPTIEVNLWEYHTLVNQIIIPNFVKTPGVIIVNGECYMFTDNRNTHQDNKLNYIKTTMYNVENLNNN